jgi:hypothetical protein
VGTTRNGFTHRRVENPPVVACDNNRGIRGQIKTQYSTLKWHLLCKQDYLHKDSRLLVQETNFEASHVDIYIYIERERERERVQVELQSRV